MPKVRGRPPKGDDAKRHSISLRVTPQIMEKLDAAISANGKSLAQELEQRVERTFEEDQRGKETGSFLRTVGGVIDVAEGRSGKRWTEDAATYAVVMGILSLMLDMKRPPLPDHIRELQDAADAEVLVPATEGIAKFLGGMKPGPKGERLAQAFIDFRDDVGALAQKILPDVLEAGLVQPSDAPGVFGKVTKRPA